MQDTFQANSALILLCPPYSVHIISADPHASPEIDPHYLESEVDLFLMTKGMQFADKVTKQGKLAEAVVRRHDPSDQYQTTEDFEEVSGCLSLHSFCR